MKHSTLILVIFLALLSPLAAQNRFDAALALGVNLGQIDGDNSGHYTHFGIHGGIQTSFALSPDPDGKLRMLLELGVTQKGANKANTSIHTDLLYVEIPILITYSLFSSRLRLGVGWAPAILARAKVTDAGVRDPASEKAYRRMDWVPLCADITYFFNRHWAASARINASFLSIMDNPSHGTYRVFRNNKGAFNNYLSFNLIYRF